MSSTLDLMRADWQQRAVDDPLHYIATDKRDPHDFAESGVADLGPILDGVPTGGSVLEIGAASDACWCRWKIGSTSSSASISHPGWSRCLATTCTAIRRSVCCSTMGHAAVQRRLAGLRALLNHLPAHSRSPHRRAVHRRGAPCAERWWRVPLPGGPSEPPSIHIATTSVGWTDDMAGIQLDRATTTGNSGALAVHAVPDSARRDAAPMGDLLALGELTTPPARPGSRRRRFAHSRSSE